jgi:hypothetical protein
LIIRGKVSEYFRGFSLRLKKLLDFKITRDKIDYLRNKKDIGISAWKEGEVIGKKAKNEIKKNKFITYDNLY